MLSKTLTNAMTACAIALAPASLHAFSYDGWCLLVGLADGSEHYVYVDEKDVDNAEISTFDGKTMKIKVTDKAVDAPLRSYEFEYENVSLIKLAKHAEEQTGIAGIGADGGRNYIAAEDVKWNITIENNTFFNFSTRGTHYMFDLRYIPCVTSISCRRNLFVLAADDADKRDLNFAGANIRQVNVDGGLTFTVKDNYSVGCRERHLKDDGIFTQYAFSAVKYSFGAFASGNLGTAEDLKVKVGATPLTATQMFRNPNPRFIATEANQNDPTYHAAPADIYNDLRITSTPQVLNHEIVTMGIGDTRWYK